MCDSDKGKVIEGAIRVRAYPVLVDAVESGVAYGWRRAHKYCDAPDDEAIQAEIEQAVLTSICERFRFDNEDD